MACDIPRAWEIAKATRVRDHDPGCAYQQSIGVLLCDCTVLTSHPEYTAPVLYTRSGAVRVSG